MVCALALAVPSVAGAAEPAAIAGTVTGEGAGPLGGVQVCAEGLSDAEDSGCATTIADGSYEVSELPEDEYAVAFYPREGNFVGQFWNGKTFREEPTLITLPAGTTETGIDAELEGGAEISGVVTAAATGLPVAAVEVCAFQTSAEGGGGCAETDATGAYTIAGLEAGVFEVVFLPEEAGLNLVYQRYESGLITLLAKEMRTGVNAALQMGGQISGTVRSAATGAPLKNVEVCISEADTIFGYGCLTTPTSGAYRFLGVWEASFKIVFSPEAGEFADQEGVTGQSDGYPAQWWNEQPNFVAATPIAMAPPAIITGIDGALGPPATPTPPATSPPAAAPVKTAVPRAKHKVLCRKGLVKRKIKGKARCVKRHKVARRHHKRHKAHKTPRARRA